MYTGLDVFFIVLFTIFVTSIITVVLYSCLVVSGLESRDSESYMEGFIAGANDARGKRGSE